MILSAGAVAPAIEAALEARQPTDEQIVRVVDSFIQEAVAKGEWPNISFIRYHQALYNIDPTKYVANMDDVYRLYTPHGWDVRVYRENVVMKKQ